MGKLDLYTDTDLDGLRLRTDPLADAVVLFLAGHPHWCGVINSWKKLPTESDTRSMPEALATYFSYYQAVPDFANPKKLLSAQEFFGREAKLYLSLLGFYALPYCYAIADGAQVLVRSRRITTEVGIRLSETALFVLDVFEPGMFLGRSDQMMTIAKVRLIHAFSRYFIGKSGEDWNSDWGLPVNQEDMLGTNLAFSLMVLRGMAKLYRYPGKAVLEDLLHYWKLVGYYLGLDIEYCPDTAKEAVELERLIRKRHLRSSEAGRTLMKALIDYYQNSLPGRNADGIKGFIAWLLGPEASAALGLEVPPPIPAPMYGWMLGFGIWRLDNVGDSYREIKRGLGQRFKQEFGRELDLKIPFPRRS